MSLYQKIKDALPELIQAAAPGGAGTGVNDTDPDKILGKLPSERQLQQQFDSTRLTVREALMRLEAEGVIYRQNRIGWFLCPKRLLWDPIQKVNFYQLAKNQGLHAETALLNCHKTRAGSDITGAFSADKLSEFYEIYRIRYLNRRPVMVEEIYCPAQRFEGLEEKALDGSITAIFQQDYQVKVTHEQSDIIVTALPDDKAEQLNLNGGAACLKIIRKRFNALQELVDYNIEYWLHSAIEMRVQSH